MKALKILTILFLCTAIGIHIAGPAEAADPKIGTGLNTPVSEMIWDEGGDTLILLSPDNVSYVPAAGGKAPQNVGIPDKDTSLTTVSGTGIAAAVSSDMQRIFIYEPGSSSKEIREIETGFPVLSVSISDDGTQILADSADQIRTVIYDIRNGEAVGDLEGFRTAAPVYDSSLSNDGKYLLWHSRGTFAVQEVASGKFGATVSLWDFASSFALSPDNRILAVGIINDDYENGAVIFFDPQSGSELGRTLLDEKAPYALSFSGNSAVLFAADESTLYRIDPKTFEVTRRYIVADPAAGKDTRISRIAASPDGSSAAVLTSAGDLFLIK